MKQVTDKPGKNLQNWNLTFTCRRQPHGGTKYGNLNGNVGLLSVDRHVRIAATLFNKLHNDLINNFETGNAHISLVWNNYKFHTFRSSLVIFLKLNMP